MVGPPQSFDRATIERAFGRLGELAVEANRIVEISVYGGSALILTLDARPATRDVDAVFNGDPAFLRQAAETIAADFGWNPNWLNDGVKGFLSAADVDPDAKLLFRTYPSEAKPGLRVLLASPAYLFAMKSLAMRGGGGEEKRDMDDIRRLGVVLNVQTAVEALEIVLRYYPADRLPPKTRFGLEEIFGGDP
jgi:hypothetical protein